MSSSYIHCVSQRWTWARGVDIHLVSSVSLIHPAINRKCRGFRSIQPSQTGIWRGEEAERIRISTFTVAIQRWSRFHRHWRGSPTARGDMLHHVRLFTISACLELIWTGRACWVINDPNKFFHSLFLFIGLRSRRERLPGRRRGLGYRCLQGDYLIGLLLQSRLFVIFLFQLRETNRYAPKIFIYIFKKKLPTIPQKSHLFFIRCSCFAALHVLWSR